MKAKVFPATADDVSALLRRGLRESDRLEAARLSGRPIEDLIWHSYEQSDMAFCAYVGEDIIALGGVGPKSVLSYDGFIWMMGHEDIEKHQRAFLRITRLMLDVVHTKYPRVENVVDASNVRTIRWLKWLGFQFLDQPVPSPLGFPMLKFWRCA